MVLGSMWAKVRLSSNDYLYGHFHPDLPYCRLEVPELPPYDPKFKIALMEMALAEYLDSRDMLSAEHEKERIARFKKRKYQSKPGYTLFLNRDHILSIQPMSQQDVLRALGTSSDYVAENSET